MPRCPVNYENTHFYKIVCKDLNIPDCYVGHTTDFIKRKSKHKGNCNNPNDRNHTIPLYQFIRENGGFNNFDMVLINTERCENSLEARKREREYIEQLRATLNIVRPFITTEEAVEQQKQCYENKKDHYLQKKKEYYENNKEKILQDCKEYRDEHKEQIQEYKKEHYQNNKEYIKEKSKQNYHDNIEARREQHKEYYELHKAEKAEYDKVYRQQNKEKIAQQKKEWANRKRQEKLQQKKAEEQI